MTYEEIEPFLKDGKIGMLPHYDGYFHWSWGLDYMYMKNKDTVILDKDLEEEKKRTDWFYII